MAASGGSRPQRSWALRGHGLLQPVKDPFFFQLLIDQPALQFPVIADEEEGDGLRSDMGARTEVIGSIDELSDMHPVRDALRPRGRYR